MQHNIYELSIAIIALVITAPTTILKIMGSLVVILFYVNKHREEVIIPNYGGSWRKWVNSWIRSKD